MYARDFGILLLSICALFFSLQNEGPFSFKKAWYYEFEEVGDVISVPEHLPAPIVADLNGDGKPEILSASPNGALVVIAPKRPGNGFAKALEIANIDLSSLLSESSEPSTVHAAAIGAGFVTALPNEMVWSPRKQAVVVVTNDLQVLRLDHNLKLVWKQDLREHFPEGGIVREVAIHVSEHKIDVGDQGLIVVGASVTPPTLGEMEELEDIVDEEIEMEGLERHHARGRRKGGRVDELQLRGTGKIGRHFSYFAFEGGRGDLRWKHEAEDFHRNLGELQEEVRAQQAFHTAAQQQDALHYGEASCRDYREAVLAVLPHSWHSNYDTALKLAHFEKHRAGKGSQKETLSTLATKKPPSTVPGATVDSKVKSAIGTVVKGVTQSGSERRHAQNATTPNVLVAHLEEGLEVVHLFSGRTVCRLYLPSPGLHADLNGDGIPDHAVAIGGDPRNMLADSALGDADKTQRHLHHSFCHTAVLSGIPPQQPLFNGTICRPFRGKLQRSNKLGPIEVAPPMMLPLPGRRGRFHGSDLRRKGLAVFLNSRGEITAYESSGAMRWQVFTPTQWKAARPGTTEKSKDGDLAKVVMAGVAASAPPTLVPLPLRVHAIPTAILASGDAFATIISEHGRELDSFELPAAPTQPLKYVDFNFDGYNDIILTGRDGMYGWGQVRKPGALPFSALVGGLIVIMLAVFVTQQGFLQASGKAKGRSTDRID